MGPFRAGSVYGAVAVLVAVAANLHFLLLDASGTPGWILGVVENFRTTLALAAILMLGILAALRTTPQRIDEGVPYKALLLRDCTLAATIVAVLAGLALMVIVFLQATVLSGAMQSYAADAAPRIVAYVQELGNRLSQPTQPVSAAQIEHNLAPPTIGSLGQSISNFVLRALLLGVAGALVGLIRGRLNSRSRVSRPEPEEQTYPYEDDAEGDATVSRNGNDQRGE